MWFYPNSYKLFFSATSTSSPDSQVTDFEGIEVNKWNDLRVKAIGSDIKLFINNIYKAK